MPDAARRIQSLTCTHSTVNIFMRYMQNNTIKDPSWTNIKKENSTSVPHWNVNKKQGHSIHHELSLHMTAVV